MRSLKTALLLGAVMSAVSALGVHQPVFADDSLKKDVQDSATDAKTNTKKTVRKVKRTGRKATGTDNVGKDLRDKAQDAGDEIKGAAEKTKH